MSAPGKRRIWATADPFWEGGDVLGRKVANAGFLTALLQADPYDEYHFYLNDDCLALGARLADTFPAIARRGGFVCEPQALLPARLRERAFHCLHLSDCLTLAPALERLRNAFSERIFPITGPTHSLSYARYAPLWLARIWPGASGRDAIVVTSRAAGAVVSRTFERLRGQYRLPDWPAPRLERIPLGVFPDDFIPEALAVAKDGVGARLRAKLGLPRRGEGCVFLCLARISASSKMDLMPALLAFKKAEGRGLDLSRCVLLLAGWAEKGEPLPEALRRYAGSLGIRLVCRPRPDDAERRALFAAADVFLSPSDNIQETFGLTLAEAGAAGLPAIASDFDGYRDIVEHGQTGLLASTTGFAAAPEADLLSGLWFDNQYHLRLAQSVAVDLEELAGAIARLAGDADLRLRLGRAARARIETEFSWSRVIARHVEMWNRLAETPLEPGEEERLRRAAHPLAPNFGHDFHEHCSRAADEETLNGLNLRRTALGEALYRGVVPPFRYAGMELMLDDAALRRLLLAARKPARAAELCAAVEAALRDDALGWGNPAFESEDGARTAGAAARADRARFHLLWALKQGYLERVPEGEPFPRSGERP